MLRHLPPRIRQHAWRQPEDQKVDHAPQGPHISLPRRFTLRRQVLRRAPAARVHLRGGEPEVAEDDGRVVAPVHALAVAGLEEDVVGFDVAVHDGLGAAVDFARVGARVAVPPVVEQRQCVGELVEHVPDEGFGHVAAFVHVHDAGQIAPPAEVVDGVEFLLDPPVARLVVVVDQVDDVGVPRQQLVQDVGFVGPPPEGVDHVLRLLGDVLVSRAFVFHDVRGPLRAFADLFDLDERHAGVRLDGEEDFALAGKLCHAGEKGNG